MAALAVPLLCLACADAPESGGPAVSTQGEARLRAAAEDYVQAYFEMYPTRATAAGRTEWDGRFELPTPERLQAWSARNADLQVELTELLDEGLDASSAADARLLLRQAAGETFRLDTLRAPASNPLYWTRPLGNAGVFLLVRTRRPVSERLDLLAERARSVEAYLREAERALTAASPEHQSAELFSFAERQARASSAFFLETAPRVAAEAGEPARAELEVAGAAAAAFADRLAELGQRARGTARLGRNYARALELWTGDDVSPDELFAAGERALEEKVAEASQFVRSVWDDHFAESAPKDDRELLRTAFLRLGDDRASNIDELVADYRSLVEEAIHFVSRLDLLTLPEFSLITDRSPAYFVGQSVGGVYSPGPYAPEGETLFYLPTPRPDATAAQREALFRDFNHHFNVMIVPHEIVPGHDTHLRWAARHPSRVRALFADAVTVEGWGTFSERLLLDLGWGDDLARIAHLKKQLENIARTLVDIGVHTRDWPRDRVIEFVREEALQEDAFAANMWQRTLTTAPQLVSYWLGYERFQALYGKARVAHGEHFEWKPFLDRIMQVAPVGGEDLQRLVLEEPLETPATGALKRDGAPEH